MSEINGTMTVMKLSDDTTHHTHTGIASWIKTTIVLCLTAGFIGVLLILRLEAIHRSYSRRRHQRGAGNPEADDRVTRLERALRLRAEGFNNRRYAEDGIEDAAPAYPLQLLPHGPPPAYRGHDIGGNDQIVPIPAAHALARLPSYRTVRVERDIANQPAAFREELPNYEYAITRNFRRDGMIFRTWGEDELPIAYEGYAGVHRSLDLDE